MALFNMPQLGPGAMPPAGLFGGGQMPGPGGQATQALLAAAQPRPPVGAMPQGAGGLPSIPPQYLAALAMLLRRMGGGAPFGMGGGAPGPAQAGMPGGQMGMPPQMPQQMPLPQQMPQGLPLTRPPMVR